ncbi:phytanoyl-CoA dioxygenase family protein [Sphingopyxis sp.]|uniref:phytanoyl-CoA dioxygenase family protein n=1 Tax=Sphingopyxis sp. TaxID=1908224 RepID=UPI002EDA1BEE
MARPMDYMKVTAADLIQRTMGNRGDFSDLAIETARVEPNALPTEVCATLRSRIDDLLAGGAPGRVWQDKVGADMRIFGLEAYIDDLIDYFHIPENIRNVEAYVGRRVRSWTLMANRITPKADNLGSGGGLHRDSPFSHQVKSIWYLSDVGEENGPFQFVRGSHRDLVRQRHKYPLGVYRFDKVADPLTSVTGPAGTRLICNTRCIHGGKPIVDGARYAVTLYTFYDGDGTRRFFASAGLDPAQASSPGTEYARRAH